MGFVVRERQLVRNTLKSDEWWVSQLLVDFLLLGSNSRSGFHGCLARPGTPSLWPWIQWGHITSARPEVVRG